MLLTLQLLQGPLLLQEQLAQVAATPACQHAPQQPLTLQLARLQAPRHPLSHDQGPTQLQQQLLQPLLHPQHPTAADPTAA